jgi:hypothetical protein
VDDTTDRVIYCRRQSDDLRVVLHNLQMMMDWDSHINVEYNGSAYCVIYIYKYCFKGPNQRERIEMNSEQEHYSHDKIILFMYGQLTCAMSAMWRFYGCQDYPASYLAVCSFIVQT